MALIVLSLGLVPHQVGQDYHFLSFEVRSATFGDSNYLDFNSIHTRYEWNIVCYSLVCWIPAETC